MTASNPHTPACDRLEDTYGGIRTLQLKADSLVCVFGDGRRPVQVMLRIPDPAIPVENRTRDLIQAP